MSNSDTTGRRRVVRDADDVLRFRHVLMASSWADTFSRAYAMPTNRETTPAACKVRATGLEAPDVGLDRLWSAALLDELWNRVRPKWVTLSWASRPWPDVSGPGVQQGLPELISTPEFVFDEVDFDSGTASAILSCVCSLRDHVVGNFDKAVRAAKESVFGPNAYYTPWEGDGWISPVTLSHRYFYGSHHVALSVASCGVLYTVDNRDADWLAARRASPFHWHNPFELETET